MAFINRRRFLQASASMSFLSGAGVLGGMSAQQAFAADVSGYKALVCVMLRGGMDHSDTLLPHDAPSYNNLASIRAGLFGSYGVGSGSSSRDRASLLALNPENTADFGGRVFALPPELPDLHALFESGKLAIIGNVGPLFEPATRSDIEAKRVGLPARLGSHNDQQSTWMSLSTEGSRFGWGGRFVDATLNSGTTENAQFAAISTGSTDVFLTGQTVRQYRASPKGPGAPIIVGQPKRLGNGTGADAAREILLQHFASTGMSASNVLMSDLIDANARADANNRTFLQAMTGASGVATPFPGSTFGQQLQTVAETISIRTALNARRQIFFVETGGYDTHSGQSNKLPTLHASLNASIAAFNAAMVELGVDNNVTLFTMSDFGRMLVDNGDGTDHGWAGHHFVVGGAVKGKRIYGDVPEHDLAAEHYIKSRGNLIPSVAVEQYAATLGKWFGLDPAELAAALPLLGNFSGSDLGFL